MKKQPSRNNIKKNSQKQGLIIVKSDVCPPVQKTDKEHEEERRFFDLMEIFPEPIIELDTEGNILFANRRFFELFGYTREEFKQSINIIRAGEKFRKYFSESFKKLLKGENLRGYEYNALAKNGTIIPVKTYSSLICKDGKIKGLRSILIDVREQKKIERNLHAAKYKAEESDRLKSAFLANMSHEIRTPMNSIIGFAELLMQRNVSPAKRKEYLTYINNSGSLLLNIIDDIIDIAKIEAGQLKIELRPCPVNSLLDELQTTFREELATRREQNVKLFTSKSLPDQEVEIITDPLRLKQILTNLVGNAIKFTPSGSIEIGYSMQVKNKAKIPMIRFFVKDTGIGISRANHQALFERFRQLENPSCQNQRGTGLGLAISKNLVELLGGNIHVESKQGKGSTFYFSIPYNAVHKSPIKKKIFHPDKVNYSWHNKVILVAEDTPDNYQYIKEIMKKTKARLMLASNGQQVMDILNSGKKVDLVLMDVQLPEMDGYETTVCMKKKYKHIPIVIQTAYAMFENRKKFLLLGCEDYLSKPYTPASLLSVCAKYLS